MSDIFISYASADRNRAEALARALESHRWSVWWDRVIPPGRQFDEVIEEALDAAHCVVVLWSKASVVSSWVKTEAAEGMRRKILIPALIEDVKLPLEFRRVQTADLSRWTGNPADPLLASLLSSIEGAVGRIARPGGEASDPYGPHLAGEEAPRSATLPGGSDEAFARPAAGSNGKSTRAASAIAIAVVIGLGIAFAAYWDRRTSEVELQKEAKVRSSAAEHPQPEARAAIDASDVVAARMAGRWRTKAMIEKEELRITADGRNVTVDELNAYGQPAATWRGAVMNGVFQGDYYFNAKKIGTATLQLSDDGRILSGTIHLDPDSNVSSVYFRQ